MLIYVNMNVNDMLILALTLNVNPSVNIQNLGNPWKYWIFNNFPSVVCLWGWLATPVRNFMYHEIAWPDYIITQKKRVSNELSLWAMKYDSVARYRDSVTKEKLR